MMRAPFTGSEPSPLSTPLVFSIAEYDYLRDALCSRAGFEAGRVEIRLFPDGERYQRIIDDVDVRDVMVVGGTISDAATLALYDLASGLVAAGARRLTLVVPYYGYSTMERAVVPGEVVTAKTRARLLSSIPPAADGNRLFLFDLHSEGIAHYFDVGLTARHVRAHPLICGIARRLAGEDFVLGSTDAGRAKWVAAIANEIGVEAGFVYKRRLSGSATEVTAVNAAVKGRRVVIYDDMIRTGGSLLDAARVYRDAGATELFAVATHGVLPGDAMARITRTGLFTRVACTDSHPRARALDGDALEVTTVADLLVNSLQW